MTQAEPTIRDLDTRLSTVEIRLSSVETKVGKLDEKLDTVVEFLSEQIHAAEERTTVLMKQLLAAFNQRVNTIDEQVADTRRRVGKAEVKLLEIDDTIEGHQEALTHDGERFLEHEVRLVRLEGGVQPA